MTEFVSYLADLTDPTYATREVDLNGAGIAFGGPFEIDENSLDLGVQDLDGVWLAEEGKDEDVLSAYRRGRVVASFNLRMFGSADYEQLRGAVLGLNRALDRFGVWVHQPPGQELPLYIDYYPSPLTTPFVASDRGLFKLFSLLQKPEGFPVQIIRRPKMRGALLAADVNLAHNGTLAEDHDNDGRPTYWDWLDDSNIAGEDFDWTFGAYVFSQAVAAARFLFQVSDADVVQEGSFYTFAADVAGSFATLPGVCARIDWYDDSAVFISTSLGTTAPVLYNPLVGFHRPSVTAAAPTGAAFAHYGVQVTPATGTAVTMYLRGMQFEQDTAPSMFRAGFEVVSNDPADPFHDRIWLWNPGNVDGLAQLRAMPDEDALTVELAYSRRSGFRDSALAMRNGFGGWRATDSTTLLGGATSVADALAAGGNAVRTALLDDVLQPCLRHELTQTEESAFRGTWHLKAAIRGGLGDGYQLEAHYGVGDVTNLASSMTRHHLDLSGPPSTSDYYVVDLGLFRIPTSSDGFFVELWAARDGDGDPGTGQLYVSCLWPEPADDHLNARARILGVQPAEGITETFTGGQFITPPDGITEDPGTSETLLEGAFTGTTHDVLNLNEQWEAGGLPLSVTATLNAVEHTFVLTCDMYTLPADIDKARKHGELRVHDLDDDVQIAFVSLWSNKGATWTSGKTFALKFTPNPTHAHVVYVVASGAVDHHINVRKIDHSFIPPVEGGAETIAVDADSRRAYVLQGNIVASELKLQPPFPKLNPLLNLLRLASGDLASNGSDVVLDGGPAVKHVPDRTLNAGVHLIPRWSM